MLRFYVEGSENVERNTRNLDLNTYPVYWPGTGTKKMWFPMDQFGVMFDFVFSHTEDPNWLRKDVCLSSQPRDLVQVYKKFRNGYPVLEVEGMLPRYYSLDEFEKWLARNLFHVTYWGARYELEEEKRDKFELLAENVRLKKENENYRAIFGEMKAKLQALAHRLYDTRNRNGSPQIEQIRIDLEALIADKLGSPWERAVHKVRSASPDQLKSIWEGLRTYDARDYYDPEAKIKMDDWAQLVYGEMCHRGLPTRQ